MIGAHWRYLSYVVRHKWFVLRAGLVTGAPFWRLLIHDWSKFLPVEWFPYVEMFYGLRIGRKVSGVADGGGFEGVIVAYRDVPQSHWKVRYVTLRGADEVVKEFWALDGEIYREPEKRAFDRAWLHHQHANPHHWQHWVLREDDGGTKVLQMPEPLVREMVADWAGAGRAITGKWGMAEWYRKTMPHRQLHPTTARRVGELVQVIEGWIADDQLHRI